MINCLTKIFLSYLVFACGVCWAQGNDYMSLGTNSDQPINITSRRFSAKNVQTGKEVNFDGSVKVQQGDLTLTCDRLTILYDDKPGLVNGTSASKKPVKELQTASGIKSIIASGNVKIVQNDRMATAGRAVFDNSKRTITLSEGPPRLWQGPDALSAQTIIIYLDENRSELAGGDDTLITAVINPSKQKKDKEK